MVAVACLDASWLERIQSGQLSDAEIEQVAAHLEGCPACAAKAQTVEEYAVLAAAARSGAKRPELEPEPVVLDLMRRLRDLSVADTATSDGNTPFPNTGSVEDLLLTLLAPADGPDELGRLGIYRVRRILGKGGMGLVLEAEDTLLKRSVALKIILPHLLGHPGSRERFLREARAAAALQSDHIIPIHQVGEENGVPFLAMPLLRGETLACRLRREGKLPLTDVLRLGREIAQGLAVAHAHGLIHRDIKPSNIWLETKDQGGTPSSRVKILDFGLARDTKIDSTHLTGSGTILGTPAYMAPEQVDHLPLDGRCDLFSFGCVLYQMSTGKSPFGDKSVLKILRSLSTETPAPARTLNPALPTEFSALVEDLLAKDSNDRPASAGHVEQELAQIEARLSGPPRPKASAGRGLLLAACVLFLLGSIGYFFGGQITRVATNRGELIVVVDDPNVVVKIVHNGVHIEDTTSKRVFTLIAGKGEIDVLEKDGIKLATRQFELTRGGSTTLKVTLQELADARKKLIDQAEKSKAQAAHAEKKDPPFVASPSYADRRAAEWVLSVGGTIQDEKGAAITALPPGAFSLVRVKLPINGKFTDEELAHFKDCKNLTHLDLSYTRIGVSAAGLVYFRDCKNLMHLNLYGTQVGNAGLAHFKDCKNLVELNLQGTMETAAGLAHFKDCKNLTVLQLGSGTGLTAAGLAHFKDCKDLTVLQLTNTKVSAAGLAAFKDCKNLTQLYLNATDVNDEGLAHFKDCKNLTSLALSSTQVTDAGLIHFKDCKDLTGLSLGGLDVSDVGLAHFMGCANLKSIDLRGTKVGNAGLAFLKNCAKLASLNLHRTQVSDAGLAHLKNIDSLRELILDETNVGDAGLAFLKDCELSHLNLQGTKVTDVGLVHLKTCETLRNLNLRKTTVSAAGIAALEKALPNCLIVWDGRKN